jgi:hypothetical protein
MFHLAAYTFSVGGSSTATLTPVPDNYLPASTNGFLMPSDMSMVAAYAQHSLLSTAQVQAPSLLRTAFPFIRPVSIVTPAAGTPTDPNVQNLISHPPRLRATENVSIEVTTSAGPADQAYTLLWLCDQLERVPPGEKFVIRFTTTSGLNPNIWSSIGNTVFTQSLPPGRYASLLAARGRIEPRREWVPAKSFTLRSPFPTLQVA